MTLAERFGKSLVEGYQFEDMVTFVQAALKPFSDRSNIAAKVAAGGAHLLGTSGTVTTIAGVYLGLSEYHRAKVDGCWLSTQSIRQVSQRIAGMGYEERAAQPCIGKERADLTCGLRHYGGNAARVARAILAGRRQGLARRHIGDAYCRGSYRQPQPQPC